MTSLNNYILIFIFLLSPGLLVGQCVSGDCENGYGVYKYKNGAISKPKSIVLIKI